MCVDETEFKKLKIRVDEIYEWMTLTQNKEMQEMLKKIDELQTKVNSINKKI